ncbi:hypothetical protein BDW02DRAFT_634779 [Decorospora gaudefroyi]|uniref:DUF7924 domain-containing protein n=1 Tax=Decorospora gaudefroyi TaxID=184978 RepID=A0A6A5K3C6_9PLEO|nr:hypothetical protein BDW02DRAFT_634779 [Decorospora gaudefroyi]
MNSRVSKPQTRHSRVKLPEALLLDTVASTGAELRASHRRQSPVSGARDAPVQPTKRRFDATPEIDPLPAKRARLTRTGTQRPEIENEKLKQADKQTTLQQPKSNPPYASFLKDFVDPVHPDSRPESVYTFVSEWLESVGSGREKRCRSDSYLHRSDDSPISRNLTRSAPEMDYTRDTDTFVVPPTPASTGSRSHRADIDTGSVAPSDLTGATPSSNQSSSCSLVEDPLYRSLNLASNNIYMRNPDDEFPEHITELIDYVRQDRDSPGPSPDQLRHNADLYELENGAAEPEVEEYFRGEIFPKAGASGNLKRIDRQPMAKQTVPSSGSKLKLSTPVPDMLYGYNRHKAFPQQAQLISMGNTVVANNQDLIYPVFVIEFKGDGESDEIQPINSAAFSIAMNGTEARLYISWKHSELDFYMQKIDSFLLQKPKDYLEFRKHVRNIVDWGKDGRLNEIRNSLDSLLEESRKRASEAAKSRQPPSDGSAISRSKKHKSSSSRRNSSKSSGVSLQSWGKVDVLEGNENEGRECVKDEPGN